MSKRPCRKCGGIYEPSDITLKINKQYCSKACQNEDIYSVDYTPTPLPDLTGANCEGLGTNVFHPAGSTPPHVRRMCATCPVVQACGEYGVKVDVSGIWGGMNEAERARLAAEKGIMREGLTFDHILQMQYKPREVENVG